MRPIRAFTLLELLVVMGIIITLTGILVSVMNPVQILQRARDTKRIQEIDALNQAIKVYQADFSTMPLGTSTTVYVSIPDTSSSCANLGLQPLPAGWNYACVSTSTLRSINGAGWIPINFTQLASTAGSSPISTLPTDPLNSTSTGEYYTYTPGNSAWVLTAAMEAPQNRARSNPATNGGYSNYVYEAGTDLTLAPKVILARSDGASLLSGLVGWWTFDEGTGSSAADSSGNGNTGSLVGNPQWVPGLVGKALLFSGSNYVNIPNATSLNPTNAVTISAWTELNAIPSVCAMIVGKTNYIPWGIIQEWQTGEVRIDVNSNGTDTGRHLNTILTPYPVLGQWYHYAMTYSNSTGVFSGYVNGVQTFTANIGSFTIWTNTQPVEIAGLCNTYYPGAIQDVRIYNRALSAAEVQTLYNSFK